MKKKLKNSSHLQKSKMSSYEIQDKMLTCCPDMKSSLTYCLCQQGKPLAFYSQKMNKEEAVNRPR